ncbi:CLUMA_CG012316, isoform A [Clunio marinus]|uniref:CLUMA_CG012316, isoform A n=1 Tax=Clunio marinus TaxID=568069 RepID=A0A1J1IF28_9DIPT|nr:CLUMA_CG012316, isoform A [Clunio marinus]
MLTSEFAFASLKHITCHINARNQRCLKLKKQNARARSSMPSQQDVLCFNIKAQFHTEVSKLSQVIKV